MWIAAAAVVAILVAFSARYGFHRDELYFIECGRHLAWGYVDQPWFTPAVARLATALFGGSLVGLRLFPSLAAGATVVLAGMLARELGGGGSAQRLAAVGTAAAPGMIGAAHIHGPTIYDFVAWAAIALVLARVVRTGDRRLWLVLGAVVGIGSANKHSVAFLALALAVGLVMTGDGRRLLDPWVAGGAVIALLIAAPEVVWQAHHGWATIHMTRRLNEKNGGLGRAPLFVVAQLSIAATVMLPVWWRGLGWLRRDPSARPWRAFVWAYGLLFAFFALTAGNKPYYLAPLYTVLVAAGAVVVERNLRDDRWSVRRWITVTVVVGALGSPIVLPMLPASAMGWVHGINPTQAEMVGWPEFTRGVATAWAGLTPAEREHAVIFTASYGEAGAVNRFGPRLGLPRAVSGHNNYWYWGPGDPTATTVVAIAPGPGFGDRYAAYLRTLFREVTPVATLTNREGLDNEESGGHIFVCRRPVRPWGELWRTRVQHYD